MNTVEPLERSAAEEYAAWFGALADGTRVQVVSLLARSGEPMSVKQIVAAVRVGQSTVSVHLKRLAEAGLLPAEHSGTARLYRVNPTSLARLHTAPDLLTPR